MFKLFNLFSFSPLKHLRRRLDNDLNTTLKALAEHDAKTEYLFWLSKHQAGETLSETKKRVFLELPKAEGELRLVQLGNAYILKKLNTIAKTVGVDLFPVAGTLLGAIRHHGFIPWDDDIDIGLFRDDLPKLASALKGQRELTLHKYYSPAYVTTLIKVKFAESDTFWVDLWIYDRVQASGDFRTTWERTQHLQRQYFFRLREVMGRYYTLEGKSARPAKDERIDIEMEIVEKELLEQNASWYNVADGDGVCLSFIFDECYRKNEKLLPVRIYYPLIPEGAVFEDEKYDCIQNADVKLVAQYGDYLSFPKSIQQCHSSEVGELTPGDYLLLQHHGFTSTRACLHCLDS